VTAAQVHLAGLIVAVFAGLCCAQQWRSRREMHPLWLVLLLVGIVCFAVTL
jgi:hypothetical protein